MSERRHVTYETPAPAPALDESGRLVMHAWVDAEPPRAAFGVQWDAGDEAAALAEVTAAFDAVSRALLAAVVTGKATS